MYKHSQIFYKQFHFGKRKKRIEQKIYVTVLVQYRLCTNTVLYRIRLIYQIKKFLVFSHKGIQLWKLKALNRIGKAVRYVHKSTGTGNVRSRCKKCRRLSFTYGTVPVHIILHYQSSLSSDQCASDTWILTAAICQIQPNELI